MEDAIRFKCHKCENMIDILLDKSGSKIICIQCKRDIIVPSRIYSNFKIFDNLSNSTFSPRSYLGVFYGVPIPQLRKLLVAFDFIQDTVDYFYYGSNEIQIEGTKCLIVTNDRTCHLPMSDGKSVLGEAYLSDKLYFIRGNDNGIYSFGYDHGAGLLDPLLVEQLYISVSRSLSE